MPTPDNNKVRPPRSRWRIRLLLLAGSLAVCELVLWIAIHLPHPYATDLQRSDRAVSNKLQGVAPNRYLPSYHAPVAVEMQHDGVALPGLEGSSQFTIGPFGFRSPRLERVEKAPGETRVFCIGGSTTECLYLDDREAWPEVVQRELGDRKGLDVINAGHSGDCSRDHVALLTQRVVPFAPDVVIFMPGINDMFQQMGTDYSPLRDDGRAIRRGPKPPKTDSLRARVCDLSQLARAAVLMARYAQGSNRPGDIAVDRHGDWVARERQKWQAAAWADDLRDPDIAPEYAENLRTLIGVCRAHGAVPVLVTQATLWGSTEDGCEQRFWRRLPDQRRVRHQRLWQLLERFNDVTRAVAQEQACAIYDLAVELPKQNALFYDDDHFTVAGARAVGSRIAQALRQMPEVVDKLGN